MGRHEGGEGLEAIIDESNFQTISHLIPCKTSWSNFTFNSIFEFPHQLLNLISFPSPETNKIKALTSNEEWSFPLKFLKSHVHATSRVTSRTLAIRRERSPERGAWRLYLRAGNWADFWDTKSMYKTYKWVRSNLYRKVFIHKMNCSFMYNLYVPTPYFDSTTLEPGYNQIFKIDTSFAPN